MKKSRKVFFWSAAIALSFLFAVVVCLSALVQTAGETQNITVVLDAGHGGIDGGVCGVKTGVKESEINLAIVRKLHTVFENAGIRVVLTRKTDAGLYGLAIKGRKRRDMIKRKEIIEKATPAVVVSIHQNSCSAPSRRGAQLFFRQDSEEGERLADNIQSAVNALSENGRKSVPLAGDYYMLNCTNYASVICECGFLTNAEDEALLISGEYQQKLAYAIYKGVVSYLSYETAVKSSGNFCKRLKFYTGYGIMYTE